MKKIILIALSLVALVSSCGKMLDVTPANAIYDEQIKKLIAEGDEETQQKIVSAMVGGMVKYMSYVDENNQYSTGAASYINYYASTIDYMHDLFGQDIVFGYNNDNDNNFYNLTNLGNNSDIIVRPYWFLPARSIANANKVLAYMTADAAKASKIAADGRARCLIVRAFNYMQLMETFQDAYLQGGKSKLGMPWYSEFDLNANPERDKTSEETYNKIIADLKEAVSLLEFAGTGYTDAATECGDLDLGVANFLLARAALWTGDYATCISAASKVIASGKYKLMTPEFYGGHNEGASWAPAEILILPEKNGFISVRNNTECILGYYLGSPYIGNTQAVNVVYRNIFSNESTGVGSAGTPSHARINDMLYEKINSKDCRQDCFHKDEIGDYKFATITRKIGSYCNLKFAANRGLKEDGDSHYDEIDKVGHQEYCQFRLGELYLMKAEAEFENNNKTAAETTMNELLAARAKSGQSLTCADYGGISKDMIRLQWRIEMWGENAREWANNKRWGVTVTRSGNHWKTGTVDCTKLTSNLPENEILYGCGQQN